MEIAKMMRVAGIPVVGTQVTAREQSIEKFIKEKLSAKQAKEIARLYYTGVCEDDFLEWFVDVFHEDDSTFADDCKNEIQVLAGIAANEWVKYNTGENNSVIPLLEFYVLIYQFLGYEAYVPEISKNLINDLHRRMQDLRESLPIKNERPITALGNNMRFKTANEEDEYTDVIAGKLDNLVKKVNEIIKMVKNTEQQSQIIFEDTQILWWKINGFSYIMGKRYMDVTEEQVKMLPLVVGKELAQLISIFPGPFAANALLCSMLEKLSNSSDTFEQYIDATDESVISHLVEEYSIDTPILYALSKRREVGKGNWKQSFNKKYELRKEKFTPLEMAYETYVECLISEMVHE